MQTRKMSIGIAVLVLATGGSAMLGGTAWSSTGSDSAGTGSAGSESNTCSTMDQYGQFVPDDTHCFASATGGLGY